MTEQQQQIAALEKIAAALLGLTDVLIKNRASIIDGSKAKAIEGVRAYAEAHAAEVPKPKDKVYPDVEAAKPIIAEFLKRWQANPKTENFVQRGDIISALKQEDPELATRMRSAPLYKALQAWLVSLGCEMRGKGGASGYVLKNTAYKAAYVT